MWFQSALSLIGRAEAGDVRRDLWTTQSPEGARGCLLQPSGRAWAWRRFSATVEIPETACGQEMNIVCKATDVGYNTQPERMDAIYNFRGIIANAWQHVKVTIV